MPISTIGTNSLGSTAQIGSLTTASGSAPSYSARAWVNFNGTGTVAIRASGNVSSITDNGTGDYTVNFTVAMVDGNYCVTGLSSDTPTINTVMAAYSGFISASSVRVVTFIPSASNALTDRSDNFVSIVR